MPPQIEIPLIAVLVASACALPGVFLVLRQMSMMSDSITHTILLGIVLAFFAVRDLSSPVLIVGAALMGVATVWLTELLCKTRLVSEDSAIGVVFPLLFSIAVILITQRVGSVHLDTDSVLLGELAFAPFDRLVLGGVDVGAKAVWVSGALLLLNLALVVLFFKELKAAAFDPVLAAVLGFSPALLHYGLMTLVSLTAVGAFQSVGSVLVVAFMIGPPVTAYLLTDDLKKMLLISVGIGAGSGLIGYRLAIALDGSIAGSMAVTVGVIFFLVFLAAPERGLIRILLRKRRQRITFARKALLLYLDGEENDARGNREAIIRAVQRRFRWEEKRIRVRMKQLERDGYVRSEGGGIRLTERGRQACGGVRREFSLR